jgi:hypothetical protein
MCGLLSVIRVVDDPCGNIITPSNKPDMKLITSINRKRYHNYDDDSLDNPLK